MAFKCCCFQALSYVALPGCYESNTSMWPLRAAAFRHFHMWLCQAAMNLIQACGLHELLLSGIFICSFARLLWTKTSMWPLRAAAFRPFHMWLCQAAMNLIQSMWPSRAAAFRHFHMWLCQAAMNLIQSMWPSRAAAFRHFHMWLCQAAMNLVYGFLPWCHVVTTWQCHMSG